MKRKTKRSPLSLPDNADYYIDGKKLTRAQMRKPLPMGKWVTVVTKELPVVMMPTPTGTWHLHFSEAEFKSKGAK